MNSPNNSREELFLLWKKWDKANKGPLFPLDAQSKTLPKHLNKTYRYLWYSFDGLSHELGTRLKKGWNKTPRDWRRILLLAASEWLWDSGEQAYATLSQWGEVCRRHCGETALKVVNGTLRGLLRDHGQVNDLTVLKFLPKRLLQLWESSGEPEAALVETLRAPRVQFFNPISSVNSTVEGLEQLEVENLEVFQLIHGTEPKSIVESVPGFFQNLHASMLIGELVKLKKTGSILDYCSAPGGKSWQLGKMQTDPIYMHEVNPDRAKKVLESQLLKELPSCQWISEAELNQMTFDNVLIDVPCGNSGVLVKSPEAMRHLWYPNDDCAEVQNEILSKALGLLKDEGRLFYSTCSIDPIENSYRIQRFCESMSLQLVKEVQWWPNSKGGHGAYLACLEW